MIKSNALAFSTSLIPFELRKVKEKLMQNKDVLNAKIAKKDEFYTRIEEIDEEVKTYIEYNKNTFRDKVILLPADNPFKSNFFKYFAVHFNDFGIKRLIATCIGNETNKPYKAVLDHVKSNATISDIEAMLQREETKLNISAQSSVLSYLHGDDEFVAGDFRSKEVTQLKDKADIIITNPPFSLFRAFIDWVKPKEKKILVIGNLNAITYRNVFPLIQHNCMWLGASIHSGDRPFYVSGNYPLNACTAGTDKQGRRFIKVKGVRWFTNLKAHNQFVPLHLMTMQENIESSRHKQVKGHKYFKYDNYNAIEVPFTDAIPSDYKGLMGVPVSFIDKYDPARFEILGKTNNKDIFGLKTKIYTAQNMPNYTSFNNSPVIYKDGKYIAKYVRLMIRNKF